MCLYMYTYIYKYVYMLKQISLNKFSFKILKQNNCHPCEIRLPKRNQILSFDDVYYVGPIKQVLCVKKTQCNQKHRLFFLKLNFAVRYNRSLLWPEVTAVAKY